MLLVLEKASSYVEFLTISCLAVLPVPSVLILWLGVFAAWQLLVSCDVTSIVCRVVQKQVSTFAGCRQKCNRAVCSQYLLLLVNSLTV